MRFTVFERFRFPLRTFFWRFLLKIPVIKRVFRFKFFRFSSFFFCWTSWRFFTIFFVCCLMAFVLKIRVDLSGKSGRLLNNFPSSDFSDVSSNNFARCSLRNALFMKKKKFSHENIFLTLLTYRNFLSSSIHFLRSSKRVNVSGRLWLKHFCRSISSSPLSLASNMSW